jgi:hypothetical protein
MTLVACPYHSRKSYALDAWERATSSYDRLLAVCDEESAAELEGRIPYVVYEEPKSHRVGKNVIYGPHFNAAWRAILEQADGMVLSLEADVIPPCDIAALMEEHYTEGFLIQGVPWRASQGRKTKAYEMGCTLGSVEDFSKALAACEQQRNHYDEPRNLYGILHEFPHTCIDIVELTHLD